MMPFSCENGATLYFPKTIFKKIKKSQSFEDYWKINLTNKNSLKWYKILKELKKDFHFEIICDLSKKDILKLTNLRDIKQMLKEKLANLSFGKTTKKF